MKLPISLLLAAASLVFAQDPQAPKKSASNIELTVYIVSGLAQPPAGAKDEVPPDLSSVVQQFHGVFMYKNYKLIDQFELRSRNGGGAAIGGELSWTVSAAPPNFFNTGQYDFRYARAWVNPGEHVVHMNALQLQITRNTAAKTGPTTVIMVMTDLDIPDGQKTVVGKSAVNGDGWFLVVVPKIIY